MTQPYSIRPQMFLNITEYRFVMHHSYVRTTGVVVLKILEKCIELL